MTLLILFAVVAGAGTALTPCVLPVLPGLLASAGTGGRRRPLGVILGLTITHTVAIVALASLIDGVGLPNGTVRTFAVVVLLAFGMSLLVPALAARIEAPLTRLARFGPRGRGEGFLSGLVVGGGLGFVYAPCAGPILAAVVSVSATRGASGELVAVALGYAAGSAVVLLAIAYGGRRIIDRLRAAGRGPVVQRTLGVVMVATAVAVAADLDVRFQTALADELPAFVTNPTRSLERSSSVEDRLAGLRGRSRFEQSDEASAVRAGLPVLGTAPEFAGNGRWFNTPAEAPLNLKGLRGRVVLIDFWTYTCINCLRTMPYLRAWDESYRDRGLTIVGVHTPEFAFERDSGNVQEAIAQNRLRYPVVQDNDFATWNAWGNQYWPAKYLIDSRGRVRYAHFGEGNYEETDSAIRALLAEAGADRLGEPARARVETASADVATPETYLGYERAEGFVPGPLRPGLGRYSGVDELPPVSFALSGTWNVSKESARAVAGAEIDARVTARKVFLVLSSEDERPREVEVLLDGKPVPASEAGADVRAGRVTVRGERLYRLVSLDRVEDRRLTLRLPPGVSGYAFTFG
ncbi:MAG TPA: cytochrome c biogenesis protein DipZ [Thermoleophilaceae bacterium]|nr:cytochrome c biogenesis protein DipZ [Actinomycetota bacterium]HYN51430.1 cytochrome c biogenesis protein DipZ [Thermoleophilaceae bacterium]